MTEESELQRSELLLCVNWIYKIKLMNQKLEWIWKVVS